MCWFDDQQSGIFHRCLFCLYVEEMVEDKTTAVEQTAIALRLDDMSSLTRVICRLFLE